MITALRQRHRVDSSANQTRAGKFNLGRAIYLALVAGLLGWLGLRVAGPSLYVDADGVVVRDRAVVASEYTARILATYVEPGAQVEAGTVLAKLQSYQVLETMAELTAKRADLAAREAQARARLDALRELAPLSAQRSARADAAAASLDGLASRNLTTVPRQVETVREAYEARREAATASAEIAARQGELSAVATTREELDAALARLRESYNEGRIVARSAGTVGPVIASPGTVVRVGDPILELLHGRTYVLAYFPMGRFYEIKAGDRVVVTDGAARREARVARVNDLAEALPADLVGGFGAAERQQVVRVGFEGEPPFPLRSRIRVVGAFTPGDLGVLAKTALTSAPGLFSGPERAYAKPTRGPAERPAPVGGTAR